MFGLFRRKETDAEIEQRIHVTVQEKLSEIGVLQALAHLHLLCLQGDADDAECNDLVIGAYRTLFIAAGLGRTMMVYEGQIGEPADRVATALINTSGLANIVKEIRSSVPRTELEPLLAVMPEISILYKAAEMMHQCIKKKDHEGAFNIWHRAVQGGYRQISP
jgi:hypothetical protein